MPNPKNDALAAPAVNRIIFVGFLVGNVAILWFLV
jgi:hypothetical protein